MYEQNDNFQDNQEQPHQYPPSGNLLATASLVCAILGIVSVCCLYGAFIFGGLAIIFGLLSRGSRKSTVSPAKTAICLGIAAVLISSVITAASFINLIHQYGSFEKLMDAYTYTLENSLGIDLYPESDSAPDLQEESDFL